MESLRASAAGDSWSYGGEHGFAELFQISRFTDYFRAYTAKSYKDVLQHAAGRFDPAVLRQNRLNTITQYRQQLAQNPNLTPEDIDTMVCGRIS